MNRPNYAIPFADLFRELTPAERRELAESIKNNGVMVAVNVYTSAKHGPSLLDGANRWTISGELGVPCPVNDLGTMSDKDARELAEQLNHCRRHLTPADWRDMAAKRAERIRRVVEKRQQGKTQQQIADEEGISKPQVQRDLKEAVGTGVPTEPEAGTVKGKDGKTYKATKPPAKQPKAHAEPVNQSARADDDDTENSSTSVHPLPVELPELTEYDPILETEQPREPTGARPLPEFDDYSAKMYKFAEEKVGWRSRWDRVIRQFRAMIEELDAIAGGPSGHHLRNLADRDGNRLWKPVVVQKGVQRYTITMYQPLLDAVVMLVKTRPDAVCAACGGRECPACRQSGFTPAGGFDAKEQQQELFGNDTNPWD
jgi:ParB-like chromosome segregation protein Spo0J